MLDVHVGVRRDELKPFGRILTKRFGEDHVILSTMEDRWENWGKRWPDDQTDPEDIIHVIITTNVPMNLLNFLVHGMMVFLDEITDEDNPLVGKFILVTDAEQWASFYHELSYPE